MMIIAAFSLCSVFGFVILSPALKLLFCLASKVSREESGWSGGKGSSDDDV